MTNTTVAATDSDDYSNISKGLSFVPINNLVFILGSMVLLTAILCSFWQFSMKKKMSDSPKDSGNAENTAPPLPKHKSVRFADEDLGSEAHVTPQMIPTPTKVTLAVGSDLEDEDRQFPERSKRSSSIVTNFFRSLSRSLSLYSINAESEDLSEVEDMRSSSTSECHDTSMESITELADDTSDDFSTMSSPGISPVFISKELSNTRNRSKSEPIEIDENGFHVGEEVEYRGKLRWKRGIVTSINPLKVQGEGNYRARAYDQVRKLRVLPSKIGEEVDDMDVHEMTFDDFKRLMKSARQNTRTSRHILADAAKSQSQLVETLARNQK